MSGMRTMYVLILALIAVGLAYALVVGLLRR
jgi:hypothetical protein